jgi:hypothetical protein
MQTIWSASARYTFPQILIASTYTAHDHVLVQAGCCIDRSLLDLDLEYRPPVEHLKLIKALKFSRSMALEMVRIAILTIKYDDHVSGITFRGLVQCAPRRASRIGDNQTR